VASSADAYTWTSIVTGLSFYALAATEFSPKLLIGCKGGKIISSTDMYNWSYTVSNTSGDIKSFYSAYGYDSNWGANRWYVEAILKNSNQSPSVLFSVGDIFAVTVGGNPIDYELRIDSIEGVYFTAVYVITPTLKYTYTGSVDFNELIPWTTIFKNPDIKCYSDENCTVELNSSLYLPVDSGGMRTYRMPNYTDSDITAIFSSDIDITNIEYLSLWIRIVYVEYVTSDWGYVNQVEVEWYIRQVTLPISNYDIPNNTVSVTGFDFPDNKIGYITTFTPEVEKGPLGISTSTKSVIGIPFNSLMAKFTKSAGLCETIETSVWFKSNTTSKYYDNLLLVSRVPYIEPKFNYLQPLPAYIGASLQYPGVIHNASIRNINKPNMCLIRVSRNELTYISHPNKLELFLTTPLGLNYLSMNSRLLIGGIVFAITNLNIPNGTDDIKDFKVEHDPYTLTPQPQAIVDVQVVNSRFSVETALWYDYSYNTNKDSAKLVIPGDVKTITGNVSMSSMDLAGSGFYNIRSTGAFKELQNVTYAEIIINGLTSEEFYYVSPDVIAVRYVTGIVPDLTFTGTLEYIKYSELFEYSSDSLQQMYEFTPGSIEFNLDSEPGVWKRAIDLAPMTGSTVQKVNIKESAVVNGINYRPFNILRLSGVEYNL
jgi:hypothetical protein